MCRFVEGVTSEDWAYVTNRVRQMYYRCNDPTHKNYKNYGGRGIQFRFRSIRTCAMYLLSEFTADEIREYQIDRKDNAKHYQKGNLRLVTPAENRANRRPILEKRSKSELISEICELRRQVRRLKRGGQYAIRGVSSENS
jgi:hypothetical protein